MKKKLVVILSVFLVSFFYLHQKIRLHIEAYKLTNNYRFYNELVDKRDLLLYNFSRKISLDKINDWAEKNQFDLAHGEMVFAFNTGQSEASSGTEVSRAGMLAQLNSRIFNLAGAPEALAEEKE